jgi:DnaJ like chaperone protein
MARTGSTGTWIGAFLGGLIGSALIPRIGFLIGAVIGALLGHQYDKGLAASSQGRGFGRSARFSPAIRQRIYFESVFLAMGYLAKADGRVSEAEIRIARSRMHQFGLRPEEVQRAIELFNTGKQPGFPIDQQMHKLAAAFRGQPELLQTFMGSLLEIPLSQGRIKPAERNALWRLASGLGINRVQLAQLEALVRAQRSFGHGAQRATSVEAELQEAYKALGIDATASDKEVKTAYRRLMNQHHPDKLVSKGLPDSMLELAKERTGEIRAAYERIRDHRGIR